MGGEVDFGLLLRALGSRVHSFVSCDEFPSPLFGQVAKVGVYGADEVEFLLAAPAFELGFSGDGEADVAEFLEVEQAGAVVFRGETFVGAVLVLLYSDKQVAGDADIECAGGATHDVGVAVLHASSLLSSAVKKRLGFWLERDQRLR